VITPVLREYYSTAAVMETGVEVGSVRETRDEREWGSAKEEKNN